MGNKLEVERQQYLIELAEIIEEEKLMTAEAMGLMLGEIASWLMVIAESMSIQKEDEE